jgi:hypothetical protein
LRIAGGAGGASRDGDTRKSDWRVNQQSRALVIYGNVVDTLFREDAAVSPKSANMKRRRKIILDCR